MMEQIRDNQDREGEIFSQISLHQKSGIGREDTGVACSNHAPRTNYRADYTPEHIANYMFNLLDYKAGMSVLEPSAGVGNLAITVTNAGGHATCIELNKDNYDKLKQKFLIVYHADFLCWGPDRRFHRVIMCPPKDAIPHLEKAISHLLDGGILVALIHKSTYIKCKEKLGKHEKINLPHNTFQIGGKNIPSVIVKVIK